MALMMDEEELQRFNNTNTTRTSNVSEPLSLNVLGFLSGIYGIIYVTGILGNISTCIVIGRNRSMHTATNFYIFSLAISDLLLLLFGLPLELHRLWNPLSYPLGESLCIAIGVITGTSAIVTVLTIIAFTVERYIAICHPLMSCKLSKLSRVVRYITAIWICAFCAALPQVIEFGVVTNKENEDTVSASTVTGLDVRQVLVLSSFIVFVTSISIITALHILIMTQLNKCSVLHPVTKSSNESGKRSKGKPRYKPGASQRRVIRMLGVVSLTFFLCWAPFHIQRLTDMYGKNFWQPTDFLNKIDKVLTSWSNVLYFFSTAINPFLYIIMSDKFRNAFKVTLSSWCRCLRRPQLSRSYSSPLAARRGKAVTFVNQSPSMADERKLRYFNERLARRAEALTSPQSISNSSLQEVDYKQIGDELATYLYKVNCNIEGNTWEDTSV